MGSSEEVAAGILTHISLLGEMTGAVYKKGFNFSLNVLVTMVMMSVLKWNCCPFSTFFKVLNKEKSCCDRSLLETS